jgi:ferredoxin
MKTVLYYYTGTGNSLWAAQCLAQELKNTELFSMARDPQGKQAAAADCIGLVFPVHMWGVPHAVLRLVAQLPQGGKYYFAMAINAGQVSGTLRQLRKVMAKRSLNLASGFSLKFPSNYIPWGGPGSAQHQARCFSQAQAKIRGQVAPAVLGQTAAPVEQGPLWQRILFTAVYKLSFPAMAKMDKSFWSDATCNGCALCVKICPAGNIRLQAQKPVWGHRCEQCLACLQWCPQQAIQYGKKTPGIPRYHHPEIKAADMLRSAPGK